jgi:hypothetical protein
MQAVEAMCLGFDAGCEYHPELATLELIGEVRRLLAMGQRIEHLVCRYLADPADRMQQDLDGALWAYADEAHAARCLFGLGVRDTRERVRVGRALRELPRVEAAFVRGELSYSRVREVTRVAEPHTEWAWIELARTLDMRALERRVAAGRESRSSADGAADQGGRADHGAERGFDKPARSEWLTQNAVRVTFELSAEAWGLLERALEGARHAGGAMSDAEALIAVARDALSAQTQSPDASDPRSAVVVYECQRCRQSDLDAGVGLLELAPAAAASMGCGVTEIDLETEGRAVQRGGPLPAATRRAVMLRDRCRCRVPGCTRRRYVDVHHLVPRADGGLHSRSNCFVLCRMHHHLLHDGKLDVTGDAEGELRFRDARGEPLVERFAPRAGASVDAEPESGATQGGIFMEDGATHGVILQEPATRVLHVIGRRGGWSLDALVEGSGLPASAVASALTLLELGGRVRYRDFVYDPV